jgi:protein-tyrosine phosphatase
MDSEIYAKFEEQAKECTLETVNAWRNEVLANVATVLMSAKKDESHLRMGIEDGVKTPTSLWDRM